MNIGNEVKKLAIDNGVTLTSLAKYISNEKKKNFSVQNLSAKIKKGTLNINEFMMILDCLGYEMKVEKTEEIK